MSVCVYSLELVFLEGSYTEVCVYVQKHNSVVRSAVMFTQIENYNFDGIKTFSIVST